MTSDRSATEIVKRVRELLRSGRSGEAIVRKSGGVEHPIPVLGPDGGLHSWFVPVTVGELLAGFFEFEPDLTLMRYSSFQRHEASLEGCPEAELWTDATAIRHRIETAVQPRGKARQPLLTYNGVPSRLAWMVVIESPDGTTRAFYVAGHAIWEAPSTGGTDSIGSRY